MGNGLRKMQFIVRGYCDFTKRDEPLPPLHGDLTGKTFVITGANSGIGYCAARQAAIMGAYVYLLCRDQKRGQDAVESMKKETSRNDIELILCELGDF